MAFRVQVGEPLGAELVRIVREQIRTAAQTATNRRVALEERVHAVRLACKRACAALQLARPHDPKRCGRAHRTCREAARTLAPWRDATTMRDALAALARDAGTVAERRAFSVVRAALAEEARGLPRRPAVERELARFAKRMRRALRRLAGWKIAAREFNAVASGFERGYRRARRAFRRVALDSSAAAYHLWRKRTKSHAYHLRLFRDTGDADVTAWHRDLRSLGTVLGDEHDLAVLRERLLMLADAGCDRAPIATVLTTLELRRDALRTEAEALGARLFAPKPRAVVRRAARAWRDAKADLRPGGAARARRPARVDRSRSASRTRVAE